MVPVPPPERPSGWGARHRGEPRPRGPGRLGGHAERGLKHASHARVTNYVTRGEQGPGEAREAQQRG